MQLDIRDPLLHFPQLVTIKLIVIMREQREGIKHLIFALGCYFPGALSEPQQGITQVLVGVVFILIGEFLWLIDRVHDLIICSLILVAMV